MPQKVKGIVIKSNDRKEKDVNVLLFSLELGKIWVTLRGAKSPNAKMKTAQNPFTFGEFMLEEGKSGMIVTGFESIESFHEIAEDIDKYFEASAVLEAVNGLDFSGEAERANVFVLAVKALKNICFGNVRTNYVLCKFFIELFKIYGCMLNVDKCSACGDKTFERLFINYDVGELVCTACKTALCEELQKTTLLALKVLSNTELERLSSVKLAPSSELALLKVLCKNFDARFSAKLKLLGILS